MEGGSTVVVGLEGEEKDLMGEDEVDVNMKEQVDRQLKKSLARRRIYLHIVHTAIHP